MIQTKANGLRVMLRALTFLLLLGVVAVPFRSALDVGVLQDDYNVTRVLGPDLSLDPAAVFRLLHPPPEEKDTRFRPVSYLTLLVDLTLFDLDPFALHFAGLLFHLAAVATVFSLARLIWPASRAFPYLAALLFGLNPVHADAVGWLAARSDPVVGFFSLATLLFYVRYRLHGRNLQAAACMGAYALALLSKEAAVVTPGLVVAVEPMLRQRARPGGFLPALTGLAILTGAYLAYRYHLFGMFLGEYGGRQAAAWSISLEAVKVAALRFVAAAPVPALRWILCLAPLCILGLLAVRPRKVAPLTGPLKRLGLLAAATLCTLLPVLPFLDLAHGRHFYLAAVPLAALVAGAGAAMFSRHRRRFLGYPVLVLVIVYALAEAGGLRLKLEEYIQAGRITGAVQRDLRVLRANHPDMKVFVVTGLQNGWKQAPLLCCGLQGLASPPFQPVAVPVVSHFKGEALDFRWEAYHIDKPGVFLRMRIPPATPGLEPVSLVIRDLPPRRPAPGWACLSPAAGAGIRPEPTLTFRFRIPRDGPWPRPLRLVFCIAGELAPLLLKPDNLREVAGSPPGSRTLLWRPDQGVAGSASLPLGKAPLAGPVPALWWVEDADTDHPGIRTVASSPKRAVVFTPRTK